MKRFIMALVITVLMVSLFLGSCGEPEETTTAPPPTETTAPPPTETTGPPPTETTAPPTTNRDNDSTDHRTNDCRARIGWDFTNYYTSGSHGTWLPGTISRQGDVLSILRPRKTVHICRGYLGEPGI